MNTSLAAIPGTYVEPHTAFTWHTSKAWFEGKRSDIEGFTGELFDGEATGFGVEGKTGEVLYFAIDETYERYGRIVAWRVRPASGAGRSFFTHGIIHNS